MLNEDTITNNFVAMFALMADFARLHYELVETVSMVQSLPEAERERMKLALEQTRQIRTRLQAFSDDLQR